MFWVISVYFNIRNALPKSCTFLLGHPVYSDIRKIRVTQGVSGTEHLARMYSTSAKEEKGTYNEETNIRTLGIYAVPRAYICVTYEGLEM